jgi:hypothetical protein
VQFSELPRLRDPLLVDMLTGEVFAVPPTWLSSRQLPVGDSPLLLAERTALYLT